MSLHQLGRGGEGRGGEHIRTLVKINLNISNTGQLKLVPLDMATELYVNVRQHGDSMELVLMADLYYSTPSRKFASSFVIKR